MRKIWIVLKSEFLRRVKSKWFVISTLLAPVLLLAMFVLPAVIAVLATSDEVRTIAVVDETGVLLPIIEQSEDAQLQFVGVSGSADELRKAVLSGQYDGYLSLPAAVLQGNEGAEYFSEEGTGLSLRTQLERIVDRAVEEYLITASNAPPELLDIVRRNVPVRMLKLTAEGTEAGNTEFYTIFGFIMGFIIYTAMFIYGAQVMYGAMEEKSSRVVEVIVSSVRPFDLLMGKVLGIGAMGLVQMVLWSILILAGVTFSGTIVAQFLDPAEFNLPQDASQEALLQAADFSLPVLAPTFFVWFILFFLGGYLLYASLFAAIGSAVEQQQDAQSLMWPITMLIIVPILFVGFLVDNPNSTFAVVMSLIPFFSPILMVVRIAVTEVPLWQTVLALALLAGLFVGAVWLSARIYRVGILMYGKKPSFRDMARWVRYA